VIGKINQDRGVTILLVEQNAHQSLHLAHRAYVLANGEIILHGTGDELLADPEVRNAYLEGGN
jgi:branched-chain amino acid transport system ATP-binding protein